MVQVDVFWSYALGAGFAASAARQLKESDRPFESGYFVKTLLYLSILFVPSGSILLWGFPEWETMQAGSYAAIPAWLVGLFSMTNVTQGILGFWIAYRLVRARRVYSAWLMLLLGYFCMFFILVHGWDGTGYQRFFYSCTGWGIRPLHTLDVGDWHLFRWLVSPVAVTLYVMGVVMLPLLFYWMSDWAKAGYDLGGVDAEQAAATTRWDLTRSILRLTFLHSLGAAIVASLLIRFLGWVLGFLAFGALAWVLLLRRDGLTWREVRKITLESE